MDSVWRELLKTKMDAVLKHIHTQINYDQLIDFMTEHKNLIYEPAYLIAQKYEEKTKGENHETA